MQVVHVSTVERVQIIDHRHTYAHVLLDSLVPAVKVITYITQTCLSVGVNIYTFVGKSSRPKLAKFHKKVSSFFDQRKSICLSVTDITCNENAESHVINGMIECFCKRGYYGNGKKCAGRFA